MAEPPADLITTAAAQLRHQGQQGLAEGYDPQIPAGAVIALADWLSALADMAAAYPEMAHDHDRPACDDYACDVMGRGFALAGEFLGTTEQQPEPTVDRAAILREAADTLDKRAAVLKELSSSSFGEESYAARELTEAADRFRHLADEAQQPTGDPS